MLMSIVNGQEKVKGFGMVATEERDLLLGSLRGYLEELRESGVDELAYGQAPVAVASAVPSAGATARVAGGAPSAAAAEVPKAYPGRGEVAAAPLSVPVSGADGAPAGAPANEAPDTGATTLCRGVGNPRARLLFAMHGAGFDDDAGDLLAKIVKAMGFDTGQVHLVTFPTRDASAPGLLAELVRRIDEVNPEVVVALGEVTARLLLATREPIGTLRGRFHDFRGRALMPTLHPEAMLADEGLKRQVWAEMKLVMQRLAAE